MRSLIPLIAGLVVLSGCHAKASAPGEAPTGVTAIPGDGLVVINWDVLPDLTYWIFFAPGDSVSVGDPNSIAIRRAIAPRVVSGLANGTKYAFVVNATHNDSAAGPSSAPVVKTPQLAGDSWVAGTPLVSGTPPTTHNLNSMTFAGATQFVAVGDGATIFSGNPSYTNVDPPGMIGWGAPVTLPPGFNDDLKSVVFSVGWVALGAQGSIVSSADGFNWGLNTAVPATGMNGITCFVGGSTRIYVVVGNAGTIFTGPDLVTWNPVVVPGLTADLTSVTLLNGFFFATGSGGTLLVSTDGVNWSPLQTNTTSTLRAITFGPSTASVTGFLYVAVGDGGTIVTSPDRLTWTPVTSPVTQNLRSVTVGGATGTRYLAVGEGGAVAHSDDGINNWTTASSGAVLSKVVFFGGLYLAVGDAGANLVSR